MRKIIITVIATIFLIAPFEKAKGQEITPSVNIRTYACVKLSFRLWRFEPFVQVGLGLQFFEERRTSEATEDGRSTTMMVDHAQRFQRRAIFNGGLNFRITDNNRVKLGGRYLGRTWSSDEAYLYLGYTHKLNLSQRVSLDLYVLHTLVGYINMGWAIGGAGGYLTVHHHVAFVGSRLNYEIIPNLKLSAQLEYKRRHSFSSSVRGAGERIIRGYMPTPNLINFSIGVHYHFGRRQQQQAQQRPPRQRVAPHQRALPCPPGQMRHLRSWDRPSSVFNHPTAR